MQLRLPRALLDLHAQVHYFHTGQQHPAERPAKAVLVTLGLFSIIQMERDVQMTIPAYDYCIPERECNCNTANPCETFAGIDFPVDEFFPRDKEDCCPCCPDSGNTGTNTADNRNNR